MPFTVIQALKKLTAKEDLERHEMLDVMREIMGGNASATLIAGLLMALRVKGESVVEISSAAEVMREFAARVSVEVPHLVDMCGTGGDSAQTFNISTSAMFVASAAGANVAKHGGRSVSSSSGSADILEKLGANIHLSPQKVSESIQKIGIGFMFAPNHHLAMKHIAPVRKELGVRTIFNILGPLTNPAGAKHQLMGVFHRDLIATQAEVLKRLGSAHVLVVHADSGLDEIALAGPTQIAELNGGQIKTYAITAQQFGFPAYPQSQLDSALKATSAEESREKMLSALENEPGPARDIVAINAAAALFAADVVESLKSGVDLAIKTIESGKARQKLSDFIAFTANA